MPSSKIQPDTTTKPTTQMSVPASDALDTSTPFFKDSKNRILQLRGVNLSGSCKLPIGKPSHEPAGFFDDVNITFVGRPFPLDQADEHLSRLRHWGYNFLRYCVTWEAIEHAGPGIYDVEYLDYVIAVLKKCREYGFYVFIDPHQDVWSRFSGGSGAPGWTLRLAGFEPSNFPATGAAIVHNTYPDPSNFPRMMWPSNYDKLAAATMFTLFFGGRIFAPSFTVTEKDSTTAVNIQDYLQSHYIDSVMQLAQRIHDAGGLEDVCVIGYDTFNEPHHGWIGNKNLDVIPDDVLLKNGPVPTPFQAMCLGEGIPQTVQSFGMSWRGFVSTGSKLINQDGTRAWKESASCIWAREGVWDIKTRTLLRPAYFTMNPKTGALVDFYQDCFKPFVRAYTAGIRKIHSNAVILVEPPVMTVPPTLVAHDGDPTTRIAYAPHWYDGITLFNKAFNRMYTIDVVSLKYGLINNPILGIRFGEAGIKTCFKSQLEMIRRYGEKAMGNVPTVMGEIGIPFDLDDKAAYTSGDYSNQIAAMDSNMYALESTMMNFTMWNYTADNCHKWGDNWNGEDLSLFSLSTTQKPVSPLANVKVTANGTQSTSSTIIEEVVIDTTRAKLVADDNKLDEGGRALQAIVRPYAIATPGIPSKFAFDMPTQTMSYTFAKATQAPTSNICEIYIPRRHYPTEYDTEVLVSTGTYELDLLKQRLYWTVDLDDSVVEYTIVVRRRPSVAASPNGTASTGTTTATTAAIPSKIADSPTTTTTDQVDGRKICPGCVIF
ncbi:hypothetical protein SmJEL517_g00430 [Synchytrium microbalum]|uniref:Glycoside hydrolase family 5 domain-containing protein n=1 Tax=Synchytrium microbalum TaxID=1806994 RepID=A0A507CIV3_9FUNG|nr:uncharacterized protein SmJEL517_g00430 [Synchytrium microbalum]TPX37623.1 hypothetical protein SmJEL517_g00430 [Synchytrium microbalum]